MSWTSVLFRWTGNRGRLWTQTWFEFRRAGVLACGVGVVIPLVILAFLAIAARTGEGVRNLPLLLTLVWLSTPIYGHLIGAEAMTGLRHRQGTTDLSPFDAAQPFRNDQLIAAKLLAMTVSSAAAWVCSSVAIGAYYLILADRGAWHEGVESLLELLGRATAPTWVLGVSSALLTFVSGTSALLIVSMWLPRYPRRMAAAMLFGFAHLVVAAVDARFGGALHEAWIVYGYVVAAAVASTCTYLVRKAWRSGAVGRRFATGVGTVWLAYVVSAVWLASRMNLPASVPAVVWCLAAALLLTPLAAALLAPLALGACRHA